MAAGELTVRLSHDEALVLFEWLSRLTDDEDPPVVHPAEEVAAWRLLGILEKALLEPLKPDYHALVAAARARLTAGRDDAADRR